MNKRDAEPIPISKESVSACACALSSAESLEHLNAAQVAMWSGDIDGAKSVVNHIETIIKSMRESCKIPLTRISEDIDEIRVKINQGDLESAANQIADTRIALLDNLFMCAGGDTLDIKSTDRLPTEETAEGKK